MREIGVFALKFILGTLIILFSSAGCSDMPYTGSTLLVHEVDQLSRLNGWKCCLLSGRYRRNLHKT